jgi:hypothetical protein
MDEVSVGKDGDRIERFWWRKIRHAFPRYDEFWIRHVKPLTYRPRSIYVRESVRSELALLATASYGVFFHLVGCYQQLRADSPDPDEFGDQGIYVFYSRLFSAGWGVERFFKQVGHVLREYDGTVTPTNFRLRGKGGVDLVRDYKEFRKLFVENDPRNYRNTQVHDWGFPVVLGRIPTHEYFAKWVKNELKEKGLGALAAFLKEKDAQEVFDHDFVDAKEQARNDLRFAQRVVDGVWGVALAELDDLAKKNPQYEVEQQKGSDDASPPRLEARVSARTSPSSGTV